MALRSPTVSRQAPRLSSASTYTKPNLRSPTGVEDDGFEEAEEPAPLETVPAEARKPRLFVNGVAVGRVQIDFGASATAFNPTGSVMERFWDQRDRDPDEDKYSRPRVFADAIIEIYTNKGFLDFTASWPGKPGVTKLVQPMASLNYEA